MTNDIHKDIACRYCNEKVGTIDFDPGLAKFMSTHFKCGKCSRINNNPCNQVVNF